MKPAPLISSALLIPCILLAGCDSTPVKTEQSEAALAAANALDFHGNNAEITNIFRRLQLTSQPGVQGEITLYSASGPVAKYPVLGKVTSSAKRLTKPEDCSGSNCYVAANDEGTYGSSDPYTFFFTPDDKYVQSNLPYIYVTSAPDAPVKNTAKP